MGHIYAVVPLCIHFFCANHVWKEFNIDTAFCLVYFPLFALPVPLSVKPTIEGRLFPAQSINWSFLKVYARWGLRNVELRKRSYKASFLPMIWEDIKIELWKTRQARNVHIFLKNSIKDPKQLAIIGNRLCLKFGRATMLYLKWKPLSHREDLSLQIC